MSEAKLFDFELFDMDAADADTRFISQFIGTILICILGYYYYISNKTYILEIIDAKIIEWKESLGFYSNKLLLKLNTQGSAVKTTQFI